MSVVRYLLDNNWVLCYLTQDDDNIPVVVIENWFGLKNQRIKLSSEEDFNKIEFISERP